MSDNLILALFQFHALDSVHTTPVRNSPGGNHYGLQLILLPQTITVNVTVSYRHRVNITTKRNNLVRKLLEIL